MKRALIALPIALAMALFANVYGATSDTYASFNVSSGANAARGADQPVDLFGQSGTFSKITSIMLFVIGAIAVIMIVIGGLRYVLSGGDSSQITAAKNTILYAIIGIIVAILAYAIINFVIGSFTPGGTTGTNV